jgi:PAS domain S-box-containing protein
MIVAALLSGLFVGIIVALARGARRSSAHAQRPLASRIADQVSDAIVAIDGDERIVFWNPGAETLYGVSALDATGRPLRSVYTCRWISPEDERKAYEALAGRGDWQGENVHVLRSGREIHVESHVSRLRNARGRDHGLLAVIRDIGARRRAELERTASEARLTVALGSIEMAVFCQDRDLRYTWISKPQLGLNASEVIGKTDMDLAQRINLRGTDQVIATKRRVLETGVGYRADIQIGEGRTACWYELAVEPLRDVEGHVAGLVASSLDVTERKHTEERLRESREQLRALAVKLQLVREEEKGRIARDLHDELGQLLTALKINLRSIETGVGRIDPENASGLLDRIVAASELADQTAATVRRIAVELRPGILDRLGLVPTLHAEARRFHERTGIACGVRSPDHLPRLSAEEATALYRICQEALTNVMRHAAATNVVIRIGTDIRGVTLEIEDDGRGIDQHASSGLRGLGLVGMVERARALGGDVSFGRREAGGTIVAARIPVEGAAESGREP